MELKIAFLSLLGCVSGYLEINVPDHKAVFNPSYFEQALNPALCSEQISYMVNNNSLLLMRFIDSSFRTPKGILEANFVDYGNYHQCLNINQQSPGSTIEGKLCMVRAPLQQDITLPTIPSLPDLPNITFPGIPGLTPDEDMMRMIRSAVQLKGAAGDLRVAEESPLAGISLNLALCIPKVCTTKQVLEELLFNVTNIGVVYQDSYCRMPGDKQWVAADYVFIVIFSFLLLLVLLSTGYDVYQTVVLENDAKSLNSLFLTFSVYTNTRRLVTYKPVPGAIECLDGVRSLAMMWVIVGHTFVNQVSLIVANPLDVLSWITSVGSIWVTMAPITVDTFFMLSGLLLVYTAAGKMTRTKLLKNLHLFYLNRLLRMFPLLAAYVLIQASLLNRITDGPNWTVMSAHVERCRVNWWSTLLHIQNFVNPSAMCLAHSWYLAIDVQLHILSPLFLFWVLGKRRTPAWVSLCCGLVISLVAATIFNFMNDFQSGPVIPSRGDEDQADFLNYYYLNTLTRCSPFFVGMIYGYLLHLNRGQQLVISRFNIAVLWAITIALLALVTGVHYPIMQVDWDNQVVDNIINSFMRPGWALAVGWLVFACHTGYGGPINWFLSLRCFKVISRLSYGMYLVHYPLIFVINSANLAPRFFGVLPSLYSSLSDIALAVIVAYVLTMLVDAPCSTLIKKFMGGAPRPPPKVTITNDEGSQVNVNGRGGSVNRGFVNEMKTKM